MQIKSSEVILQGSYYFNHPHANKSEVKIFAVFILSSLLYSESTFARMRNWIVPFANTRRVVQAHLNFFSRFVRMGKIPPILVLRNGSLLSLCVIISLFTFRPPFFPFSFLLTVDLLRFLCVLIGWPLCFS